MKTKKIAFFGLLAIGFIALSSCGKYRKYDNNEVIENTYAGSVNVTSVGGDPAGDFTGDGDSGVFSFAFENKEKTASANFDITSSSGSVRMIIQDKKGDEVLNKVLVAGSGEDTFAGITSEGKPGMWKVTLELSNFDGDGSYSIHSGN